MIGPLLLAAGVAAAEPVPDCENAMAQQHMNRCAYLAYERADAALNEQWKHTAAAMKARDAEWGDTFDERAGFFDTLLDAQRAWLTYRDRHCASEGYWARGGSLEPLLVSTCKTGLTEERTKQLQYLIEQ